MKHINKFNEELRSGTYKSAADKLLKMGHKPNNQRIHNLNDWGDEVEKKEAEFRRNENLEAIENKKKEFSKYGKYELKIETKSTILRGYFYLNFYLDPFFGEVFEEDKMEAKDPNYMKSKLTINIDLIPADVVTYDRCEEFLTNLDMIDGAFHALTMDFNFEISGGSMKINDHFLDNYDTYTSDKVKISDRPSAGRFRNTLIKIFSDSNFDYPSSYNDFENFYDLMENYVGSTVGLSNDYGFTPEMISDYVKKNISANKLYV